MKHSRQCRLCGTLTISFRNNIHVACKRCFPDHPSVSTIKEQVCTMCGKFFYTSKLSLKKCSKECQKAPSTCALLPQHWFRLKNNYQCKRCGVIVQPQCNSPHRLHVHHKLPKRLGGTDDESNLICLCTGCHAFVHAHPKLNTDFIDVPDGYNWNKSFYDSLSAA